MSAASLALRLLFGLACAAPLLCWPPTRPWWRPCWRWPVALLVLALAASFPSVQVFFERVDARWLAGPFCRI